MPTVVAVRFPWGRFHATPWDVGANEGNPEWPPSPWRILRALLATYHWRAANLDQHQVEGILQALAGAPHYHLPPNTSVAHTRHYLPGVAGTTSKVFDPFVVVDRDRELLVRWDVDLPELHRATLATLCNQLAYLGRAEAICQARLVGPAEEVPGSGWLAPSAVGTLGSPGRRVLSPVEPLDLAALRLRTTEVRKARRLLPPSTRWVTYQVEVDHAPPTVSPRRSPPPPAMVEAVSLALGAAVRPSVRDTVWVAHVARMAALNRHQVPSPVLAGKDGEGKPLTGHHHAHYLPLDVDGDRLLDTLVVWAPGGLGPDEVGALGKIDRLTTGTPGFRPVRVALQGAASSADLAPDLVAAGGATAWESVTPFAPYRHQKRQTTEDFYAAEVARELSTRSLPPATVEIVTDRSWLDWRRARPGGHDARAVGLRLRFSEPIRGPLSLGHLSHFGLGLFRPAAR